MVDTQAVFVRYRGVSTKQQPSTHTHSPEPHAQVALPHLTSGRSARPGRRTRLTSRGALLGPHAEETADDLEFASDQQPHRKGGGAPAARNQPAE